MSIQHQILTNPCKNFQQTENPITYCACMCMCVCVCVCVCACAHAHICMYVCMMYVCVCMYVCIYVCINVCVCVCVYLYMRERERDTETRHSPKPSAMATGDRSNGPNCFGSPASTICPNNLYFSFSLVKRPATGISASGSTAWPLSSINKCEKWPAGIPPVTSLVSNKMGIRKQKWGKIYN